METVLDSAVSCDGWAGTHRELLGLGGLYASLYAQQTESALQG